MSGVVNTVKKVVSDPLGAVKSLPGLAARTGMDVVSGGAAELGGFSGKAQGQINRGLGIGGSTTPGVPSPFGQTSPTAILEQTGGAVLLANIAAGADPQTALASFLGVPPEQLSSYIGSLDDADKAALTGVQKQLTQIQGNTTSLNNASQKLVNDYPNIMAQSIQKYGAQADATIQPMLKQAMAQIAAKQSANGNLSSGATAEAAAMAGTAAGMEKLNYATGLASQDYNQQAAEVEALRGFQQKMLGQGATYGQTAAQAALDRQQAGQSQQNKQQFVANTAEADQNAALFGSIGKLAGAVGGAVIGGPVGGAIGTWATGRSAKVPAPNSAGSGSETLG